MYRGDLVHSGFLGLLPGHIQLGTEGDGPAAGFHRFLPEGGSSLCLAQGSGKAAQQGENFQEQGPQRPIQQSQLRRLPAIPEETAEKPVPRGGGQGSQQGRMLKILPQGREQITEAPECATGKSGHRPGFLIQGLQGQNAGDFPGMQPGRGPAGFAEDFPENPGGGPVQNFPVFLRAQQGGGKAQKPEGIRTAGIPLLRGTNQIPVPQGGEKGADPFQILSGSGAKGSDPADEPKKRRQFRAGKGIPEKTHQPEGQPGGISLGQLREEQNPDILAPGQILPDRGKKTQEGRKGG